MKGEEVQILVKNKLEEGKDFPEINEEIDALKKSQIIFKSQKSELTQLNKKIISQANEIKILKNKLFKQGLLIEAKKDEKREVLKENGSGDINDLKRIILILKDSKEPMCLTSIQKDSCLYPKKALSCLGFLEKYSIIRKEKDFKNIDRWFI
jgi:hypothetical protein